MTPAKPATPWPPLVGTGNIPLPVRLRDLLLTVGVWLLLGYMLRDALHIGADLLSYPFFELTFTQAPDWTRIWQRMTPYASFSALLVLWILFWGFINRFRLARSRYRDQPPELTAEEHAGKMSFEASQLRGWQSQRALVMHFKADGSIDHADTHDIETHR